MHTIALATLLALSCTQVFAQVQRESFTARSAPGIQIAIREVVDSQRSRQGVPLILLHGARVPGVPSFDLDVPGGSLAADLAEAGLAVYIVDLRGYGRSTRPKAMSQPSVPTEPLVRSGDAVEDLGAAVDAVLSRTTASQVSILGWATGGHWAGMYAALQPEKVSKIVFYNTLYGYTEHHSSLGRGSGLADPDHPNRFNVERFQNYRVNDAAGLLTSWDRSIPVEDKATWRDPAIASAYVSAALASDVTSDDRNPPSFRAPTGALADSFLLATGAALWDARLITANALIVRSGADFWSRPEDVTMLKAHLSARNSGRVAVLNIPDATHYVHLDRPERGRQAFLNAVLSFLAADAL